MPDVFTRATPPWQALNLSFVCPPPGPLKTLLKLSQSLGQWFWNLQTDESRDWYHLFLPDLCPADSLVLKVL